MAKIRLSEILKSKKISQKEFARMVGTSPQYISGICTGKFTLSIDQLSKFAKILEVKKSDLLIEDANMGVFFCPHCGMPIRAIKEEGPDQ